jgi:hypothetical protein
MSLAAPQEMTNAPTACAAFPIWVRDDWRHIRRSAMRDVAIELIQVQTFGCPSADREGVLAAYRRRTEEVCAAIPAERLLVFDVAEGWAPLCRFLDVPVSPPAAVRGGDTISRTTSRLRRGMLLAHRAGKGGGPVLPP